MDVQAPLATLAEALASAHDVRGDSGDEEDEMWVDIAMATSSHSDEIRNVDRIPLATSTEPSRGVAGAVELELEKTIVARETLDTEICRLRAELRAREEARVALKQKEVELQQKMVARSTPIVRELKPPPSLEDFLEGRVDVARPIRSQIEDDVESKEQEFAAFSLDGDDVEIEEVESLPDADDWENHLDAVGVGKCRHCGLRFPLDVEAIEKHCRECTYGIKGPQFGKCQTCGELLPLNTEEIECHLSICEKRHAIGTVASFIESLPESQSTLHSPAPANGLIAGVSVARKQPWITIFSRQR